MTLVIRPAVPADAAAIAALHAEGWRVNYRGALADSYLEGPLETDMRAWWEARLAARPPGWAILVATANGAFAGFVATKPDEDDATGDRIKNLYVEPAHRNRGIGVTLLREVADRLAALGRRQPFVDVVEKNHRARALYRDLGGIEDPAGIRRIDAGVPVPMVVYRWELMQDLALAARRRLARRLDPPLALAATEVQEVSGPESGADHPAAASHRARPRRKQRLGDPFGLADYGVNRVELDPGIWSSIPHWHSREDEFVHVLEGHLTLVADGETRQLGPGDCAGFPAGLDRAHHIENRSERPAVYLEIGSRRPDSDEVDYPGEDLRIAQRPDGSRGYVHRDDTPAEGG